MFSSFMIFLMIFFSGTMILFVKCLFCVYVHVSEFMHTCVWMPVEAGRGHKGSLDLELEHAVV